MPVTHRLSIENVNFDNESEVDAFDQQVIASGMERVRADRAELRAKGLLGDDGKLLLTELPDDMKPGAERDFGG